MKKIVFALLTLTCLSAGATHILNAQIAVKYLGDLPIMTKEFQVVVTIFRDCSSGQSDFDDTITVGMFKLSNNALMRALSLPLKQKENVSYVTGSAACFEKGTYTTNLDAMEDFYLQTSRCCRSANNNINDNQGFTVYTEVKVDSNFTEIPAPFFNKPLAAKAGATITYDISGKDSLSDSTVYEITTPIQGGSTADPKPSPFPQPFTSATYKPGYSAGNILGTPNDVILSRYSGLITLTPATVGEFFIGVTVKKYLNGKVLYKQVLDIAVFSCINCLPSGIQKNTPVIKELKVFPNPASETIGLSLPPVFDGKDYSVSILDPQGRLVRKLENEDLSKIQLKGMPAGLYFIEVSAGERTCRIRFIKD
jgi:hypothetical protein